VGRREGGFSASASASPGTEGTPVGGERLVRGRTGEEETYENVEIYSV